MSRDGEGQDGEGERNSWEITGEDGWKITDHRKMTRRKENEGKGGIRFGPPLHGHPLLARSRAR